jgi:hypothetical protein
MILGYCVRETSGSLDHLNPWRLMFASLNPVHRHILSNLKLTLSQIKTNLEPFQKSETGFPWGLLVWSSRLPNVVMFCNMSIDSRSGLSSNDVDFCICLLPKGNWYRIISQSELGDPLLDKCGGRWRCRRLCMATSRRQYPTCSRQRSMSDQGLTQTPRVGEGKF